ncbi:MAG TPA: hypothetical protein VMO17_00890, partial [Terriglobia bacterium]|nr:hypothetical protein [Terriglobia bacterium]
GGETHRAPFYIDGADGKHLFSVDNYSLQGAPLPGAGLFLYTKAGAPAAGLVATSGSYKRSTEDQLTYVNELKTYIYDNQPGQNSGPPAFEVSSLALTPAGGSLWLMNRPTTANARPERAGELAAKTGVGGQLTLWPRNGKPEILPKP